MIRFFLITLIVVLLSSCSTIPKLNRNNNKGNKKGVWVEQNDSDGYSVIEYKNGQKHGKALYYNGKNQLSSEDKYKNDKRHGKQTSYVDGKPVEVAWFRKDSCNRSSYVFAKDAW